MLYSLSKAKDGSDQLSSALYVLSLVGPPKILELPPSCSLLFLLPIPPPPPRSRNNPYSPFFPLPRYPFLPQFTYIYLFSPFLFLLFPFLPLYPPFDPLITPSSPFFYLLLLLPFSFFSPLRHHPYLNLGGIPVYQI